MADMNEWKFFGPIIAALVGLYGLFIKHIIGHVSSEVINSNKDNIQRIFESKQSKENCIQIVKRMDENHQETCRKLDRIWDKIESL